MSLPLQPQQTQFSLPKKRLPLVLFEPRVYNRRGGEYPTTLCSVLQPFTGFMTSVMIFTNVWFHGLLVGCNTEHSVPSSIIYSCLNLYMYVHPLTGLNILPLCQGGGLRDISLICCCMLDSGSLFKPHHLC